MKTRATAKTSKKKNSNRTIFKPEMAYLQVRTRTCSTFLISHHTTVQRDSFYTQPSSGFSSFKKKKKKNLTMLTLLEKKFSTKLHGQISDKNRTKNHESNTKITAQNVESSRRALYTTTTTKINRCQLMTTLCKS